ncbi:MAG: 5-formyltetrahydrofolate cyclo-ligase [Bacteroidota bacterium]|nr:5-formyltetrahydrofolate cyclo-ligase [Bacteroidota bacterium]
MKEKSLIDLEKKELRKSIFRVREDKGEQHLIHLSENVISRLEATEVFKTAQTILCYFALSFEVNTIPAIKRWSENKTILLPVVHHKELKIKRFTGMNQMTRGIFNVMEPTGEFIEHYDSIDLVIVPGLAFDLNKNRMGYGKGFYDRLLPMIEAKKAGICFEFQLFEQIPADTFDQPMDLILTDARSVL